MKKLFSYIFLFSGWIACGLAIYWGISRNQTDNKALSAQIKAAQTTKQNPVGTFVDSAGREHVRYRDGSTARIPSSEKERIVYRLLRDSLASKLMLKSSEQLSGLEKVATVTKTTIRQAELGTLVDSLKLDKWSTLIRTDSGYVVRSNNELNRVPFTKTSGLFGLKKTPMITFFLDNPNSRISGFERYEMPLPVYKPIFKVDAQADYDFALKNARTDISATIRTGRISWGIFGRMNYDPFQRSLKPSYGAKASINLAEL